MNSGALRLAVLGDPLAYTRSPDLHRAGLTALGLDGDSRALRTPAAELESRLRALAAEGVRGVNLTNPLKQSALPLLSRVSASARVASSVNTVGLDPNGWWGDTTDGPGFLEWLVSIGVTPERERIVLLGAGGAARAVAASLLAAGAGVTASARRPDAIAAAWAAMPDARIVAWRSRDEVAALAAATTVVNATPLDAPGDIVEARTVPPGARRVDMRYGPTATRWVTEARAAGHEAWDGLGMLVHQARGSLRLWTGRDPGVEPLARAVGLTP